jgi:hypothetical protein
LFLTARSSNQKERGVGPKGAALAIPCIPP